MPDAIVFFDKSIEINTADPDPLHAKAFALFQLGKFQDAVNSYEKAIFIDPSIESLTLEGFYSNESAKDLRS